MSSNNSKPPFGARVNWGNPITRGLVWHQIARAGASSELIRGSVPTGTLITTVGALGEANYGITYPYDISFDFVNQDFSWGCWVKAEGTPTNNVYGTAFGRGNSAGNNSGYFFGTQPPNGTYPNKWTAVIFLNNANVTPSTSEWTATPDTFLLATYTHSPGSGVCRFYVNGVLEASAGSQSPLNAPGYGVALGGTATNQTHSLYQTFLWNRVVTDAEVASLYRDKYQMLAPVSPRRFFSGSAPAPILAVIKGKRNGTPPLRVPASGSATFADASMAVLSIAADFGGTAELFNGAGVSQGAMTQDAAAANSGKVHSLIFSKYIAAGGSYYAVFTMSSGGVAAGALVELQNVAASDQIDATATATGSSTSPSSGATAATAQDYEIAIGAIGTEGSGTDTQGAWANGFTPIAFVGGTGGAATQNATLSLGYKILAATGAQTAAKTGITSRQWGAAIATYKGLVATAPAAAALAFITESPLASGTVGDLYSEYMEVSGAVPPYTFAVQSGSLPGGLSLSTAGAISGTPTLAGVYNFTVRATDSAAETEDLPCQITISAAAGGGRRGFQQHATYLPGKMF